VIKSLITWKKNGHVPSFESVGAIKPRESSDDGRVRKPRALAPTLFAFCFRSEMVMAVIAVAFPSDGNPLLELRRALQELEMCGIGAQAVMQSSRESGLIRVADDVEAEAIAILDRVNLTVSRSAEPQRQRK
jgi:hypothetical protein